VVSVIVPLYNAERWVRACLQSVALQTVEIEIIVVDDGSTDKGASIVAEEFRFARLIRTPNQGASRARSVGTAAATGTFIQYLDADDILAPGKIRTQIDALSQSGADVAYGDWQRLLENTDGSYTAGEIVSRQMRRDPELELIDAFWCPPAAYLFRRSIVDAVGSWNENLPVIQDARFTLDCALHGGRFVYCPSVMAHYREHRSGSLSRRDPVAFTRDIFRNACEVEQWWLSHGGINDDRKRALISCYGYVARASFAKDKSTFDLAYERLTALVNPYIPAGPPHLAMASRVIGYPRAERVALAYRKARAILAR